MMFRQYVQSAIAAVDIPNTKMAYGPSSAVVYFTITCMWSFFALCGKMNTALLSKPVSIFIDCLLYADDHF